MNYKRKRDAKKNISNAPKEEKIEVEEVVAPEEVVEAVEEDSVEGKPQEEKKVEAKGVKEEKDLKKSNHNK